MNANYDNIKKKLISANIAQRFWNITLPEEKLYSKGIKAYLDNLEKNKLNGTGIVFIGPYMTGKTSLASFVLRKALEVGYKAYSIYCFDITNIYYNQDKERYSDEKSIWKRILEVDFLLLDDFGTQKSDDVMEKLIRYRFDNNKVTIFTANDKAIFRGEHVNEGLYKRIANTNMILKVEGIDWSEKL